MNPEMIVKEIIERRRQWGITRDSDFEWLINQVEFSLRLSNTVNVTVEIISDREQEIKSFRKQLTENDISLEGRNTKR